MNDEQIEDADRLSPKQTYAPITYIQPTINEIVNNLGFDKLETLQPCQRAT